MLLLLFTPAPTTTTGFGWGPSRHPMRWVRTIGGSGVIRSQGAVSGSGLIEDTEEWLALELALA